MLENTPTNQIKYINYKTYIKWLKNCLTKYTCNGDNEPIIIKT